jgi:MFS family permease
LNSHYCVIFIATNFQHNLTSEFGDALLCVVDFIFPSFSSNMVAHKQDQGDISVPTSLTRRQTLDIFFLVLAFSCVVSAMTLVVGTGAIVVQSVGGDVTLAPFALAAFFLGMSAVSLTVTHWVFKRWGRHIGFWCGICLGLFGVLLSFIGVYYSSTALVLVANVFLGAGTGIGMYLRFAAIEVVPPEYHSKAMTWVLCGGCVAAFAGPEAAQATDGKFGDEDHMQYFGVFVAAACFFFAQAIFIYMVHFPSPSAEESAGRIEPQRAEEEKGKRGQVQAEEPRVQSEVKKQTDLKELGVILKQSDFILPVCVAILTWAIMAMPMSIFRVVMKGEGFTSRESLTVIEFHFFSMYSPGFFSGAFIKNYGPITASAVAIVMFLAATLVNVLATQEGNDNIATWYAGMMVLGVGWNFGFSGASMWVTKAYAGSPHLKAEVQAANECLVFFASGALMFATGYVYSGGGGGIQGWQTLNLVIFGLIGSIVVVVAASLKMHSEEKSGIQDSEFGDVERNGTSSRVNEVNRA